MRITGEGTIDGSGELWWQASRFKRETQKGPETALEKRFAALNVGFESQPGGGGGRQCQFLRPPLLQFQNCRNVILSGVTLIDSPFWTVHPLYCDGIFIDGVTIKNPSDAPNTDGIDVDSCRNVRITDCTVDVGDDGIALKAEAVPTESPPDVLPVRYS
uniref:Glyco_hydro_28 n=1 Tax=uncultured Spirochaeta sp. TaxID=174390 RepID=A0A060CEV8_9SPIO|nr:Glyco_hydro_28 [uncultured Spirochaeta sp.]